MLIWLAQVFGPPVVGWLLYRASNTCKGKNGKNCLRYAAWGTWLLMLVWLPIAIVPTWPILHLINIAIRLIPSVILYLMAANSMLKEIRSQQRGEYTEAA
jgi:hypothetical protein